MSEKKSKGYKVDAKLLDRFQAEMELSGSADGLVYEALVVYWMEASPEQRMQLTRRLVEWKRENSVTSDEQGENEPSAGKIEKQKPGQRLAARKPHDRGTVG